MANKFGGTLVAATNSEVAPAKVDRLAVCIMNLSTGSDKIFVEFGAVASTTVAAGSWCVFPEGTLTISQSEFPEIKGTVNLISIGTPDYIVRDSIV
jgi:hypothetical protein